MAKSLAGLGLMSRLEDMPGVGDDLPSVSLLNQMIGQVQGFVEGAQLMLGPRVEGCVSIFV